MTVLTAEEAKEALNGISSRPFQSDVLSAEEAKKALRSVPKSDNREPRTYTVSKPQEPKVYRRNADGLMTQAGIQPTIKQQKQAENAARLDALAGRPQTGAQKDLPAHISQPQAIRDFTTGDIVQTVVPKAQSAKQSGVERIGNALQSIMEAPVAAMEYAGETAIQAGKNIAENVGNPEWRQALGDKVGAGLRKTFSGSLNETRWDPNQLKWVSVPIGTKPEDVTRVSQEQEAKRIAALAPVQEADERLREQTVDTPVDPGSIGSRMMRKVQGRQAAAVEGLSPTGQFVGNTLISVGQNAAMLPAAVINPAVPLAGMAGMAGAGKAYEVQQAGGGAMEALARGTVAGLIEAATEKLPLDNLLKIASSPVGKEAIRNILKQMGTEATEETVSYVANYIADVAANDPNAEFSLKDMALSALGGGLSGGIMGAGGTVVGYARNGNVNAQAAQAAQESAFTQQAGTNANAPQSAAQADSAGAQARKQNALRKYLGQIVGAMKGELASDSPIRVGETPDILRKYGAQSRIITLNQSDIRKIAYPEGYMGGKHNLGFHALEVLPQQLENPVAILKSSSQPNSLVIFTELLDTENRPVMVAMHLDKNGVLGLTNHVASMYGRKNFENFIAAERAAGNILYENEEKDLSWLPVSGLQLPEMEAKTDPINITLPQQAEGVNTSIPGSGAENSRQPGLRSTNPDVQAMMDAQGRIQVARRTQRVFDRLGEKLGVNIVVDARGNGENGYYDSQTRTIHLNADSKDPLGQVFSHEITHRLKEASSADYLAFAQLAEEQLRRTGEYDSLASRIRDAYGELSPDALADEMVAHYAQNLVTNIDEFERLAGINRNLAQKLLDWLDEILHQARLSLQGLTTDEQDAIFRRYTFNEVADATKAWKEVLRRADARAQGSGEIRRMFVLANDAEAIARAEQMEREGKPPEEIWRETHMGRDIKNNWITEIVDREEDFRESGDANRAKYTDNEARINELWAKKDSLTEAEKAELGRLVRENSKRGKMLLDYVSNRQLQENVPGLEKTRFRKGKLDGGSLGSYNARTDGITVADGLTGEEFREVVGHEMQHAIQKKQGMANGTDGRSALAWWLSTYYETIKDNPAFKALQTPQERFDYLLSPAKKRFGTSDIDMIALQLYKSNYGEQQARNTASRVGMTEQQRFESMPQYENEWYSDGGDILKARTVLKNIGLPIDYLDRILYSGKKGVHHDGRRESNDTGRAGTVQAERRRRFYHENMGAEPGFQGSLRANEKGQILGQDSVRYSRTLAPELAEEYGAIEPGEHPTNDVLPPRKDGSGSPVRRTYRTAAESQHADERMQAEIEQVIRDGAASYQVSGDREAADYAEATLSREGFDGARGCWNAALESGKTNKNDIALGGRLFKEASSRGDYQAAREILGQVAAEATIAGQKVQAIRLIKRMGPAGELLTLEQTVRKIQKEIEPQAKKLQKKNDGEINRLEQEARKAKEEAEQAGDAQQKKAIEREIARMEKRMAELKGEITIPDEVVADIMGQKTQKGLDEAMTRAYAEIGKQVPSNWANKWNAWRYMAMLVNPTTHIRNITGNLFFRPAIALKDAIKIPMERALMPRYKGDPTAAILNRRNPTDRSYLAQGRESFEENRRMLMSSGKYNPSNEIRDNMRIFKNGVLEAIRRGNGGALEAEDLVFLRRSYERAYAQVLKANDYAAQDGARQAEIRKQAESWAAEEAWRATYRDASAIADAISRFSRMNAAANLVTEGLFPFKKTPIKVAKRGLSYSPAGLVKGLYDMTYGVKSGKVDAAHAIDQFASGLSGTAIVALGAYLASQGLLNGAGDDDDKARAYRKQVSGHQQYSLQIGDKSYTIDWLAPSSMPLFVGAELWKLKQGEAASFKDFYEAMKTLPSPMVEMSMLSSLEDAIDAASYGRSGGEKLVNFFGDAVGSYFGQAVPTLGGKVNRIIDGTQRNAYYKDKTALVPSDWVVAYNSTIRQKVPGMSKGLEPKLDVWGREQKEGLGERIAENLVSPGYLSHNKETPVDKEILRLYEKTGESSVIPNTSPNKYFNAKGSLPRYDMSAAEYTAYMRVRGTTSYELINQMISSSAYKKMGDEEKAKMIGELYQYAGEIAKRRIAPKYADKGMDKAIEICTKANLTYGQYLTVRAQADTDGNHSVSQVEAKKAMFSGSVPNSV